MSDLAPPPLLSGWPIPDASAGLQSTETVQTLSAGVAWRQLAASPPPSGETTAGLCPIVRPAATAGHTHPGLPVCSEEVTWAGCPGRSSYHQNQCAYMNLSIAVLITMGTQRLYGHRQSCLFISLFTKNWVSPIGNTGESWWILVSEIRIQCLLCTNTKTGNSYISSELRDVGPCKDTVDHIVGQTWADRYSLWSLLYFSSSLFFKSSRRGNTTSWSFYTEKHQVTIMSENTLTGSETISQQWRCLHWTWFCIFGSTSRVTDTWIDR